MGCRWCGIFNPDEFLWLDRFHFGDVLWFGVLNPSDDSGNLFSRLLYFTIQPGQFRVLFDCWDANGGRMILLVAIHRCPIKAVEVGE